MKNGLHSPGRHREESKIKAWAVFLKISEGKDQFVCLLISSLSQTNNCITYIKNEQQKMNNTIKKCVVHQELE